MVRTILIWGLIGGLVVAGLMQLSFILVPDHQSPVRLWLGYLTMLVALLAVVLGVKQYRDQVGGGVISFRGGLLIGLGITVIAAAIYSAAWEVYLAVTGIDFVGDYYGARIATAQAEHASASQIAALQSEQAWFAGIYRVPPLRFLVTMAEMLPVGLAAAIITAFAMRFRGFLPAKQPIAA
jgi:hypothetical protein